MPDLDKQIQEKQTLFEKEVLSGKLIQLEGKVVGISGRLDQFDNQMRAVVNGVNGQATKLAQQIMALEQTLISVSKIVTALTQSLVKKSTITDSEVMDQLRATEDQLEEDRINELVSAGLIELTDKSVTDSILVLRQETVAEDGARKLVSNFRTVELANMKDDDPLKTELLSKAAGDIVGAVKDGSSFAFTLKAVYKLSEKKQLSELSSK